MTENEERAVDPSVELTTRQSRGPFTPAFVVLAAIVLFGGALGVRAALNSGDGTGTEQSASDSGTVQTEVEEFKRGSILPAAQPFEMFDGSTVTLGELRGKPTVINFWASWCPSCIAELPDLQAAHAALGDDVNFLGINNQDDRALADELVETTGVEFPLALDRSGDLLVAFEGLGMPTTVFIDADGRWVERFSGTLTEEAVLEKVEALR